MTRQQYLKRKNILYLLLMIAGLLALNAAVSSVNVRLDLTAEKRYTLSPATLQLLHSLDEPVHIKVFLKGKFPAGFRHLAGSARNLLEAFQRYAGKNIRFEFTDPLAGLPDTSQLRVKDSLAAMGIMPYNVRAQQDLSQGLSVQLIFPGAIIDYHGHEMPVNLLQGQPGLDPMQTLNKASAQLEYRFAHAIYQLQQTEPPLVGYALGNGEPLGPEVYDALTTLQQNYRLDTINIAAAPYIPKAFEVLLVLQPRDGFTEEEKLKLDQYVMQGGRIAWFIDPVNASMDSLQRKPSFVAFDKGLNLDDQLFTYGLRINPDLIQDLQCYSIPLQVGSMGSRPQIERLPWPFFPLFIPAADHPIVKNMEAILGRFASSIDTVKGGGIRKTVLLASSANSRTLSTPLQVSLESMKVAPDPHQFRQRFLPVAVLLEGRFPSIFRNRLSAAMQAHIDSASGLPYRAESVPNKMIVVSDGDLIMNVVSPQDGPLPMGTDLYTRQQFSNREFFLNCLDYLTDAAGLLSARDKDFKLRLLDAGRLENEKTRWQLINFIVPVLFVLLFAAIYAYIRQRKYAS